MSGVDFVADMMNKLFVVLLLVMVVVVLMLTCCEWETLRAKMRIGQEGNAVRPQQVETQQPDLQQL